MLYSARDQQRRKEPADARIACSKVRFGTELQISWANVCFLSTDLTFNTSLNFLHQQIRFSNEAK